MKCVGVCVCNCITCVYMFIACLCTCVHVCTVWVYVCTTCVYACSACVYVCTAMCMRVLQYVCVHMIHLLYYIHIHMAGTYLQ